MHGSVADSVHLLYQMQTQQAPVILLYHGHVETTVYGTDSDTPHALPRHS